MVKASSWTDFIQRRRWSAVRSEGSSFRGAIGGRLTGGIASSDMTGIARDIPWPAVTGEAAGEVIAFRATGATEAWDIAAMVSVRVLLE